MTSDVASFSARSDRNSFELFHRSVSASGLVLTVAQDRQTTPASCGAHALASVIHYWKTDTISGDALFKASPPANANAGYSLAELMGLAQQRGLIASAVHLSQDDIIAELEKGRPVLVPVRVPAVFVDTRTVPGQTVPVLGFARNAFVTRTASMSEFLKRGLVNHYVVVAGYDKDRFIIVEPVVGLRTISFERLARYRGPFDNAALVLSANTLAAR